MGKISFYPGSPLPLGATQLSSDCYRFALFSSQATQVVLVLADQNLHTQEIVLSRKENRTGAIWHIEVEGISDLWSYAFRVDGPASPLGRFDFKKYLADPYAKNLRSPQTFGSIKTPGDYAFSYLKNEEFSWEGDRCLNLPKEESIIYEMHVRSFTWDNSSKSRYPGTFLGIIEKIDYLKKLGINAIELLPIFEFDETYHPFRKVDFPHLCNYWGYASVNFFSPCRRYAYGSDPCAPSREFKTLVKALHQAGIEVILDVVFNHTGLENTTCPLQWIDLPSYYIVDSQGEFANYSGCGNTVNTNHTPTTQLILDSLRYWVQEMHVDGFRFDLASIFSRDPSGKPLPFSPALQAISYDPILADTKIVAEPWDAAGLYQLGYFPTLHSRWSEWNGQYRDTVKAFLNGNDQLIGTFASRISGSQDLYPYGSPCNSINYICSHDGFTLYDTVAYNNKHNEENQEGNCDGSDANYSYNFGEEGETQNPHIIELRQRQMRNFLLTLFLSQGIPMLQSGDEYGHTAKGNNNRWALDTDANHFLWDRLSNNASLVDFVCHAIHFRKKHKEIFNRGFLTQDNITWLDATANPIQWHPGKFLAYELKQARYSLFTAFYTGKEQIEVQLPNLRENFMPYQKIADSSSGFVSQHLPEKITLDPYIMVVAMSYANHQD
ncbi:putative glycosyl hydrolase [Chlamydia abortus LLG]|uniref:glycogen debranching protein n=1 Tax=Chlamydia abortus TaxID=83555 RepID=UPI00029CAEB0|nr:glycogen-debranching protein [Chlamydia abortus]EGK69163.1 putative glycosyl hydrolase [Chlamydia abortus LLG]SFW00922.1 glycosyl hydrolase family protein [Chlamydia abortus]